MGSKGGSVTVGYRYYMTMQMVLGRGPFDEILEIKVGEKTAWPFLDANSAAPYDTTITDDRVTKIQAGNLFGGDKSEGGIEGTLTVRMGKPTQVYPSWFKNLLGGDVPDFRGVVTAVFDGLICALNPYPKTWKFRNRRILQGWDGPVWQPGLAVIQLTSDSGTSDSSDDDDENDSAGEPTDYRIRAMNPAHILYECVTNRTWGRGYDRSRIDETSWVAAARTLHNEKFGMCLAWKRQDTLEAFVSEVIKHIGATMFTSRETGLLELRLIRDDYNVADLPLFDYNSGLLEVSDPETATLTDAVGEVIVTYHDPVTDRDRQVRAQNLAIIQSSEGINSQKVEYVGLPTQALASRVAQRDLKAQSSETSRYTVKFDRRAWRIYPGAVFRISAPDKGISDLVLRAGKVQDGSLTTGTITVEAAMDVFGMPSVAFTAVQSSAYQPPSKTPLVIENRVIREVTYQELTAGLSLADQQFVEVTDSAIAILAGRPGNGVLNYSILSKTSTEAFVERNNETYAPTARIVGALGYYNSTIDFDEGTDIGLIEIGMLAQLGGEIIRIDDVTLDADGTSGTLTVTRGTVDTIPQTHADNSLLFFIGDNLGTDDREYVLGETVSVKLLSNTSSAQLDAALAATDDLTLVARQGKPYPPGAAFIETASGWTPAFDVTSVIGDFAVHWTHRDRISQVDRIVGHWEANVGPEAGTTYNLTFRTALGVLIRTVSTATNSYAFNSADADLVGDIRLELESERGGVKSLQKYEFAFNRVIP